MLNKISRKLAQLIPVSIRNERRSANDRRNRQSIIEAWERAGKPVPAPHPVKQVIIESYKASSGCQTLVETGTYLGDMVEAQRPNFKKIYSIELSQKLWQDAVKRFKKYPSIQIMQGDSGKVLGDITKQLDTPAIFWLDGHYSAGVTARGDKDCPIFGELDAIFKYNKLNHVLLIDDARCFNGTGDYPTIDSLSTYIKSKDERYSVEVKDDVIRYTIR